jgi:hypothetical protein
MTGLDLLKAAYQEVNILGAGEELTPEDAEFGLGKLNRLWDNWNADRQATYAEILTTFALTPALSPHTIGPLGTFVVTQRPVTIEGMNLVVAGVKTPIALRDQAWYASLSQPSLQSAPPTDCYYEPNWPLGKLYFYPVPSAAASVELLTRQVLAAFTQVLVFTLPPGYLDAIVLTLAEDLAPAYPGAVVTPKLEKNATAARARIFANNQGAPRLVTRDAGVPGGGGWFDYRTGQVR